MKGMPEGGLEDPVLNHPLKNHKNTNKWNSKNIEINTNSKQNTKL